MNIIIRRATEEDLPNVIALYAQPEMDNGQAITLSKASQIFKKMMDYPYYVLYVASDHQKIIGTFTLLIIENLVHKGGLSAIVEAVVVEPSYQGRGVGKQMMQFAMDECKRRQCRKLVLSSNLKRTKAHQFYQSLGFTQHGLSFAIDF